MTGLMLTGSLNLDSPPHEGTSTFRQSCAQSGPNIVKDWYAFMPRNLLMTRGSSPRWNRLKVGVDWKLLTALPPFSSNHNPGQGNLHVLPLHLRARASNNEI